MKEKSILVTGISSGIGLSCTKTLLAEGYTVFGSLRTKNNKIEQMLTEIGLFHPIYFDVQDMESIENAFLEVQDKTQDEALVGIVNNAGYALPGPLLHLSDDEIQKQLDVNVVGIIRVTNTFFPLLKTSAIENKTKIINISSTSATLTNPFLGAYSMSKYAVESLTDAYRREFLDYKIDVISVRPGPTKTKIWQKSIGKLDRFKETDYGPLLENSDSQLQRLDNTALPVDKVGQLISKIFATKNPKTKYTIMKGSWGLKILRLLPDRVIDRIIWKHLKNA